jgi:sugar-specific transcriptional regulator TrmB
METERAEAEVLQLMLDLGFTQGECEIYFSLIERPEGEPIDSVLTGAKMSQGLAESALKSLVDKGLVNVSSNRLDAVEPRVFLSRFQERKRQELSKGLEVLNSRAARLLSLLEPQYWEKRLGIKPEDLLEPLNGLEEMELRTVRVIGDASREVCISAETFGWFGKVQEEMYRALERGVKFRVLMLARDKETLARAREVRKLGVDIRQSREDWYPVRGTLGDNRQLVFLIWAEQEGKGRPAGKARFFRPHYTKNEGMIRVFRDAFDKRWTEASKID